MFKNKLTCPSCNERIDYLSVDCPYCHTHNFEYDKLKLSKNALNLKLIWQIIIFLAGWIGLQIVATVVEVAFMIGGASPLEMIEDASLLGPIEFITYFLEVLLMVILIFVSKNQKNFIKPFLSFESYVFGAIGFVVIYALSAGYGNFVIPEGIDTSGNQQLVISIATQYPVLSMIVLGILGPLVEELTYRAGLFGFIRRWNRVAAYIIGAFVFGAIHFDLNVLLDVVLHLDFSGLIRELWNFPSYLIAGVCLVTLYDHYGYGASSIAHILNNVFGLIEIFIFAYGNK